MDPLEKLIAIEAIKTTQARYWYSVDTKDWDGLGAVFTDDALFDMRPERAHSHGDDGSDLPPAREAMAAGDDEVIAIGGPAISAFIRGVAGNLVTVHGGYAPLIELEGADSAHVVWPMFDYIDDGSRALRGWGHYHLDFRRQADGSWLISGMTLTRLRTDGAYPTDGPVFPDEVTV